MPSLCHHKTDKNNQNESMENVERKVINTVENKLRNLEKRKAKLDSYREDVQNGKELNEDQKNAVSQYESVVGQIEVTHYFSKNMQIIFQDYSRQQKKNAKKEFMERQQREVQRLTQAYVLKHILTCLQNEDARSDFLNGENGAVQLSSEQLSLLDQLHKLFSIPPPNDFADLENHCRAMAENDFFLVEGKNKEVAGTTYKVLHDLLQSIKECGYFTRSSEQPVEDETSSDDSPDETEKTGNNMVSSIDVEPAHPPPQETYQDQIPVDRVPPVVLETVVVEPLKNGPLQEVLVSQSAFNFLQESQIDPNGPQMDSAVVAVHPMAPPSVNFPMNNHYPTSPPAEDPPQLLTNGSLESSPSVMAHSVTVPPTMQLDFDPSHPIPTQTFTNQSYAVMQNMMIQPSAYVPVTMHHGLQSAHVPIAVVSASTTAPLHMSLAPVPVTVPEANSMIPIMDGVETADLHEEQHRVRENSISSDRISTDAPIEKNHEGNNGYHPHRGGYRGRGRGRGNNYFRGRPNNYHNGRGGGSGGYQRENRFYQDRNERNGGYNNDRNDRSDRNGGYNNERNERSDRNGGYNNERNERSDRSGGYNSYRRDSNNRGPRGNGNGNNRVRNNYNRQAAPQQPQQAQ